MAQRPYGTKDRYNPHTDQKKRKESSSSSSSTSSSESDHNAMRHVYKPEPREEHKVLKNHFKYGTIVYCINRPLSSSISHENLRSTLVTQLGHIDITHDGEIKDPPKSYYIYTAPFFGMSPYNHGVPVPNTQKSTLKIYSLHHQGRDRTTQVTKILNFRDIATSLAINTTTSSARVLDLAIGFHSGEIILHDPLEKSKAENVKHFNRSSQLASGSVTKIRWVPGEHHIFAVSFSSGTLLFIDRNLTAIHPIAPPAPRSGPPSKNQSTATFSCLKQTKPGSNPLKAWHVSKGAIKDFCFSPDGYYLVAACQDGYLRFFHYGKDSLLVLAKSYYGGFLCVDWSSDGRIVIAGGEDDLVTLWEWDWSACKCTCRARGESHRSWVASLAFDRNYNGYRFGSVGEDGRLNLWEYNDKDLPSGKIVPKPREDSLWGRPTLAKLGSGLSLNTEPTSVPSTPKEPNPSPSVTDGINNKTNGHSVSNDPSVTDGTNNNNKTNDHSSDDPSNHQGTTTNHSDTTPDRNGTTLGTNGTSNTSNSTKATPTLPINGSTTNVSPNNGNGDVVPDTVEVVISVPPTLPDMVPLVSHTAHYGPCSGLTFLPTRDILTSAWGGDVKFWQFVD